MHNHQDTNGSCATGGLSGYGIRDHSITFWNGHPDARFAAHLKTGAVPVSSRENRIDILNPEYPFRSS
jgi:hypothetical protein